MSHLWLSLENQWQPMLLAGPSFSLEGTAPAQIRPRAPGTVPGVGAVVLHRGGGEGAPDGWLLLVPPTASVRVNGYLAALGARALQDRDEIRLPGAGPIYFSTEELTVVEPFAGAQAVDCPRCSRPIEPGAPAVRCPGCRIRYHQIADRGCFAYAEACTTCGAETILSDAFRWSPELL